MLTKTSNPTRTFVYYARSLTLTVVSMQMTVTPFPEGT